MGTTSAFKMTTVGQSPVEIWPFSYENVTGGCEGCNTKSGIYISHVFYFLPKQELQERLRKAKSIQQTMIYTIFIYHQPYPTVCGKFSDFEGKLPRRALFNAVSLRNRSRICPIGFLLFSKDICTIYCNDIITMSYRDKGSIEATSLCSLPSINKLV